jgi:hypothetical protein
MQQYGKSYNPPEYFFVVDYHGQRFGDKQESELLKFRDTIELQLITSKGEPVSRIEYRLLLADGTEKKGKLDAEGRAVVSDVPPGPYWVRYPDFDRII